MAAMAYGVEVPQSTAIIPVDGLRSPARGPSEKKERREAELEEKYGPGKEKQVENSDEDGDDVHDWLIDMHPPCVMPYPGCQCLLWGAGKMANTAWNEIVSSFRDMYPIPTEWGDLPVERVQESTDIALEEIPDLLSELPRPPRQSVKKSKDHFPEWQQSIVKKRIEVAVEAAKTQIKAARGI